MPHPYRIREIAQQAGLSEATVDRVLHDRGGVRGGTVAAVRQAVADVVDRGIPVVTLFTDVPHSRRVAYIGIDNRAAGATAAYLLTRWSPGDGTVLVTVSSSSFRGEEEREMGFRAAMREMAPGRVVREVTDTEGRDSALREAVAAALAEDPSIDAVYSVGGGNKATVRAFVAAGRACTAFIAHDLDLDLA